jgi:Tfp pilus assembly protein FimT
MHSKNTRGFSLVELLIVMVMIMIVTAIAMINVGPILNQTHVNNAYNLTLSVLRTAREQAIGTRRVYIVSFNNAVTPNTITLTQGNTGAVIATYNLPTDVFFAAQAGFPNPGPDSFGSGTVAIEFDQNVTGAGAPDKTSLYFYPDGSAQDSNANTNNGVVYLSRTGDLKTSRALTVWGATGRIRGWRLNTGATNYWGQI